MRYARRLFLLGAVAPILFACSQDATPTQPEPTEAERIDHVLANATQVAHLTPGTLGKVRYAFDPEALTRAELELPLPPDFDETVFAVKLIPSQLAEDPATSGCAGEADAVRRLCTAQQQAGLALALLERPITKYRTAFAGLDGASLQMRDSVVAGELGFAVTLYRGGTRFDYTFVPVKDRTLLLAKNDVHAGGDLDAAIEEVISGLNFKLPPEN